MPFVIARLLGNKKKWDGRGKLEENVFVVNISGGFLIRFLIQDSPQQLIRDKLFRKMHFICLINAKVTIQVSVV